MNVHIKLKKKKTDFFFFLAQLHLYFERDLFQTKTVKTAHSYFFDECKS